MRVLLTPRPTRRHFKEHRRDRNKANQLKMRVFWHQGPQEDRKSTEETETKQINLRWEFFDTKADKKTERALKEELSQGNKIQKRQRKLKMRVFWHQGPQEDMKVLVHRRDRNFLLTRRQKKQINLRWEFFDTKAHKKTASTEHRRDGSKRSKPTYRWEFCWHKAHKKTAQRAQMSLCFQLFKANQLKMRVFWPQGPQEDRKSTEETETKQTQLKMRVFWHQGPQEDRKSTEETETKQINLRWEFFDTKAHKKTERAQKRQKQSKST